MKSLKTAQEADSRKLEQIVKAQSSYDKRLRRIVAQEVGKAVAQEMGKVTQQLLDAIRNRPT